MKQHAGKTGVVELEVPLVVELEEGGAVGVVILQVDVMKFRLLRGEAAVFADVHLERFGVTLKISSECRTHKIELKK